jgi:KDO2-lipid IV(A) lauroyltransferase
LLPFGALARCGQFLGLLLYSLAAHRRRVALVNLELCFPELNLAQRKGLARRHFMALGRSFVDQSILQYSSRARIERFVRLEGREHWEAVRDRPVIWLAPHFAGIDVGGVRLSLEGPAISLYRPQRNQQIDALLRKSRGRFGGTMISTDEGFRRIVSAMRKGLPFYYLPDHDRGSRGAVFVPFFGEPAATTTALARLAHLTGAAVVPAVTRQLPCGHGYELRFYPAWKDYPSGDDVADARCLNAFIEERVREIPEQYYWVHRRFKTLPGGGKRKY